MTDGDDVRIDVVDGVAVLRIDRPKVNALDAAMQRRIGHAAVELDGRDDVAAVVVTGGERVFAAGSDIKEMATMTYTEILAHSSAAQEAFTAVARIGKPVVAAINGYALGGGCELALCADFRIAAEDAVLGQPEVKLGVIPGLGGTQRLARLIGPARAKDLVLTGRLVQAAEALHLGLVDQVVAPSEVLAAATAWAQQFVGGPAVALRAAKHSIDAGLGVDLGTGLELERLHFTGLFATEDRTIGMSSFVADGPGKARFVGR